MKSYLAILLAAVSLGACSMHQTSEENQERADIQYQFAYDNYMAGELIQALSSALKAKELDPKDPDTFNLLGLIYFKQEKYELAEEAFKEGIKLDEKLSEVRNNLGALYLDRKHYAQAETQFLKALEYPLYLYPERVYNNLGLLYSAQGQVKKSEAMYEKAIKQRPTFYLAYQNLGKLLMDSTDPTTISRAKNLFLKAAELCQDCSEARYQLGRVFLKNKEPEEAIRYFKQGAEMDPNGYYGQLCKKYLLDEKK